MQNLPNKIIYIVTPLLETTRIGWALRARSFNVAEVSLSLLEGRLQIEQPAVVIFDLSLEENVKRLEQLQRVQKAQTCMWLCFIREIDEAQVQAFQMQSALQIRTIIRPVEIHHVLTTIDTYLTQNNTDNSIRDKILLTSSLAQKETNIISITANTESTTHPNDVLKQLATYKTLIEDADYFTILGVSLTATQEQLKEAYTALHRQWSLFTLRNAECTREQQEDIQRVCQTIEEAYLILSNESLCNRYREACMRTYISE